MNTDSLLLDWVKTEEGFREQAYLDSLGIPTFGYGFTYITKSEADTILHNRINSIRYDVLLLLKGLDIELDEFRKAVLMDMTYQLGINSVKKFKQMFLALSEHNYDEAANQMLDSKWHTQTPQRCELLARRMKLGY